MAERISVKRTSELTGLSELTILCGIDNGELEFGRAIHTGKKRTNYHISPKKLEKYLMIQENLKKIDSSSITDVKIKMLEDKITALQRQVGELNTVIKGLLDNQEYFIKRMKGGESRKLFLPVQ